MTASLPILLARSIRLVLLLAATATLSIVDVTAGSKEGFHSSSGNAQTIYYTFKDGREGGVAALRVDRSSGRILDNRVLASDRSFLRPHKLALSESGRYLLATSTHAVRHNLFLVDLAAGEARLLSVAQKPDDLAAWRDTFVVGAEAQWCYFIDAEAGTVSHRWNGAHELRPDGRRIEYVATTSDGTAWTSWQKDSGSGNRKGSRVVTLDIPSGRTIADLRMPRALPQLHLADRKERGPSPEIIIPSARTNTLLLSMDLYGGIVLADLDAAREGSWSNLSYHSVSLDGSWGVAFPDRACRVPLHSGEYVFVANTGPDGGVTWVDLAGRSVIQSIATPPGLSSPIVVSGGRTIVAPVGGKVKWAHFGALHESRKPRAELHLFDIGSGGAHLAHRVVSLPSAATLAAPVAPEANDLVVLTLENEFLVVRSSTGAIVDRGPASGEIFRTTHPGETKPMRK